MKLDSLEDVFIDQLADLHSAERQLVEALPRVTQAVSSKELREALEAHLEETRGHVQRLEQVFELGKMGVPSEHCEGMEGLLREGNEIVRTSGNPGAKDAAIIAAAQRVEHYEIAGYGTACALADELGYDEARDLLAETLDEEGRADKKLTSIAQGGIFREGVNEKPPAR